MILTTPPRASTDGFPGEDEFPISMPLWQCLEETYTCPEAEVELPPAIRDQLLDPAVWQPSLKKYALATHLAVALTDAQGQLLGPSTPANGRALRASKRRAAGGAGMPVGSTGPARKGRRGGAGLQ